MKKILKILLPLLAFAQTSIAAEENGLTIKPKGSFDFSIGALKDNGPHTKKTVTANKNGYGFLSSASVSINVENRIEDKAFAMVLDQAQNKHIIWLKHIIVLAAK